MRTIAFRAWDKDNNKMLTGVNVYEGCRELGKDEITISQIFDEREDNPYIPMQCTGLKDKNGKEIYEGDIVLYPDVESEYVDVGVGNMKVAETEVNSFGEVKFEEGTFGIICPNGSETLEKGFKSFWWITNEYGFELNKLEVIGNIYENPELLQ